MSQNILANKYLDNSLKKIVFFSSHICRCSSDQTEQILLLLDKYAKFVPTEQNNFKLEISQENSRYTLSSVFHLLLYVYQLLIAIENIIRIMGNISIYSNIHC